MALSVSETAAVNPKVTKTLLANSLNTFLINSKATDINSLRKLRKCPFWLVIFLIVSYNKISLFSKELITCIIYFILLSVSVSIETVNFEFALSNLLARI